MLPLSKALSGAWRLLRSSTDILADTSEAEQFAKSISHKAVNHADLFQESLRNVRALVLAPAGQEAEIEAHLSALTTRTGIQVRVVSAPVESFELVLGFVDFESSTTSSDKNNDDVQPFIF